MRYTLLAPRRCEGCGETFQPQRRNQTYHNQACKQTAYYQRTKRNKNCHEADALLPSRLQPVATKNHYFLS